MVFLCILYCDSEKSWPRTAEERGLSGGPWANQLLPQEVRDANEKTDKTK